MRAIVSPVMFRTKKDVDKHVQDIHSKIKSPSERNLNGYSIAKLYFGVGVISVLCRLDNKTSTNHKLLVKVEDYENARRFLASYLMEKDTGATSVAHKLHGQIQEKLNQPDKVSDISYCLI